MKDVDPFVKGAFIIVATPFFIHGLAKDVYKSNPFFEFKKKKMKKKTLKLKEDESEEVKQSITEFLNQKNKMEHENVQYLEKLKELSENSKISKESKEILHLDHSLEYIKEDKLSLALLHCMEVLKLSENHYYAFYLLSIIYNKQFDSQKSIEASKKSILFFENYQELSSDEPPDTEDIPQNVSVDPIKKEGFIKRRFKKSEEKKGGFIKKGLNKWMSKEPIPNEKKGFFRKRIGKEEQTKQDPSQLISEEELILHHISNLLHFEYYTDVLNFLDEHSDHFESGFKSFTSGTCHYYLNNLEISLKWYEDSFKQEYQTEKSIRMIIMCLKRLGEIIKAKQFEDDHPISLIIPQCHIYLLNRDQINTIIEFMDIPSLLNLSSTCKMYRNEICEKKFWNREISIIKRIDHIENHLIYLCNIQSKHKKRNYPYFVKPIMDLIYSCPFKFLPIAIDKNDVVLISHLIKDSKKIILLDDSSDLQMFKSNEFTEVSTKKDFILSFFQEDNMNKILKLN
jgi:hypothetical protein